MELKNTRKGHTKVHTLYTTTAKRRQEKERENKKLHSPLKWTQPINEVN